MNGIESIVHKKSPKEEKFNLATPKLLTTGDIIYYY